MEGTKATARRFPAIQRRNTRGMVKLFKIKEILQQQKTVDIKKNRTNNKNNKSKKKVKLFFLVEIDSCFKINDNLYRFLVDKDIL